MIERADVTTAMRLPVRLISKSAVFAAVADSDRHTSAAYIILKRENLFSMFSGCYFREPMLGDRAAKPHVRNYEEWDNEKLTDLLVVCALCDRPRATVGGWARAGT